MNHICKTIHQDTVLQKFLILAPSCSLKVSKIIPKGLISQPASGCHCGCSRDIAASREILNRQRGIQHFAYSVTKLVLLLRPSFNQVGVLEKLQCVSGPHYLSYNSSTLDQTFSTSRNYTTTSRTFSATTVASSAIAVASSATTVASSAATAIASSAIPSAEAAAVASSAIPLAEAAASSAIPLAEAATVASSAATVASSAIPSAEAVTAVISSSTSQGLIAPDFFPIFGAERAIEYIHQLTGLPWWATIVLTAFILRVVLMVPLTVHSFHNMAKLQNMQPEVKEKAEKLAAEVRVAMRQFHWTEKRAKEEYRKNMNRLLNEMYVRENCHPNKGIAVTWVQMPVWISVSYALRNLSLRGLNPNMDGHVNVKDLSEQGLAWFPDLTATDGTWLLPIMVGTVTLFNTEMNYLNVPVTRYRKWITYWMRGVSLFFVPICSTVPSSMVLYWFSSGTFGAVQNLLFEYSPFRRLLGLPKSSNESHSPLRSLAQKAKERYLKK